MPNTVLIVVKGDDKTSGAFKSAETGANSLGKTMGTVIRTGALAAGAGLGLAVVAAFKFGNAASSMNESLSKSQVVFGASAKGIEDWSKNAAKNFGQSRQEALEMAATFGNLFSAMGLGQRESAGLGTKIVELASDLASFNNIPIDEALIKLRAGLVGEAEPLRVLGVQLTEATVKAKAMQLGLADANGELSEGAKVQARYALIMEQTKNAQGDFARTADGAANSQRILSATWKDTQVTLGQIMLPLLKEGSQELTAFLVGHQDDIDAFSKAFAERIPYAFSLTKGGIESTVGSIQDVIEGSRRAAESIADITGASSDLRVELTALSAAMVFLFPGQSLAVGIAAAIMSFHQLRSDTATLSDSALDFKIAWLSALVAVSNAAGDFAETITGVVRGVGRGLGWLADKFGDKGLVGKAAGALEDFGKQPPSTFLKDQLAAAEAERLERYGESIRDNLTGALDEMNGAAKGAGAEVGGVATGLGGGGGAGGGGLSAAAKEARQDLINMALAFADFHAATGLGEQDFMALIQMSEHRAELDKRATQAGIDLATAQLEATDGSFQLRKGLVAIAEKAIELGGSLPKAMEAIWRGVTDSLRNAFNGLFNRPTKEGAVLDLEIAIQEEELAKRRAAGASDDETKQLEDSISSLRERKDVLDKHANVLKAQLELADQTLLTEQGRDFAASLYTIALGTASAQLDTASAITNLLGIAEANYISALNNAAAAVGGSSDPFNAAEKHWINAIARGKGEDEPFPGFDMGGRVTRTGLALVHKDEEIRPAGKAPLGNTVINVYPNNLILQGDAQSGLASLAPMFAGGV